MDIPFTERVQGSLFGSTASPDNPVPLLCPYLVELFRLLKYSRIML
jgi:hypothetical protein